MDTDVTRELKAIDFLQNRARILAAEVEDAKRAAANRLAELRKRIRAGELTSGDRFNDVVIAHHGPDEHLLAILRELDGRLQGRTGQLVLAIAKGERRAGCTGFGGKGYLERYMYLHLGILEAGALVVNVAQARCELPTGKYASSWDVVFDHGSLILTNENLPLHLSELYQPVSYEDELSRLRGQGDLALEVIVGDVEVEGWFAGRGDRYAAILAESRRLLGPPESELARQRRLQAPRH